MEMLLKRRPSTALATLGELFVDGAHECWTLEDVVRPAGEKVAGATAIPAGRYRVVIDMSPRFKRPMPHVLDVPGFGGIRFHTGNTAEDTEGCILVGEMTNGSDSIGRSRVAFKAFFAKLNNALAGGKEAWLEIQNA